MHVDLVQAERSFLRLIGILFIKVSNDDNDDCDDDYDYRCGGSIITSFYLVVNVVDINERCRSLHETDAYTYYCRRSIMSSIE